MNMQQIEFGARRASSDCPRLSTLVVMRSGMRGHRFCPSALLSESAGVLAPKRPYGRKVSDSSVRATKSRRREKSWLALSLQAPSVLASSGRVAALPNVAEDGWIVRPIATASNLPLQRCLRVRELDAVETSRRCSFFDEALFYFSWRGKKKGKQSSVSFF
eukprot:CAMPEP_0172528288 /NCGR_PEP_ID=MMETSP1067-20121228/2730_1 /TAXON_ID=265564 ORGANISM="Thalassiosira punctigera, Strain Tpunct2005C2" /NCGR_SAMPLE_ID=MMETSP1067 /ASSEMBLY_ACC=CAM_ASM_000444 /LENGTH=160 /DNA_ID=CAMNT_0013312175 /DNA_START=35 /DNA_END=518 /DNA_ORIENTATION=-